MSVPHFVKDLFPADRVNAHTERWPRRLALLGGLTLISSKRFWAVGIGNDERRKRDERTSKTFNRQRNRTNG